MATIPTQDDWTNNTVPNASDFNSNIRDTVNFLFDVPRVCVFRGQNQTVNGGSWSVVTWGTGEERYDSDGMYASGTRITAVTAGWYDVKATSRWEENPSSNPANALGGNNGARGILICRNANGNINNSDFEVGSDRRRATDNLYNGGVGDQYGSSCASVSGYVFLDVNDYVEVFVNHDMRTLPVPIIGGGNDLMQLQLYHVPDGGTFNNCRTVQFSALWIGA